MSKITSWDVVRTMQIELVVNGFVPNPNVVGKFFREIIILADDSTMGEKLSDMLDAALRRGYLCGDERLDEEPADLFITFRSQGYDDPGSTYNPETAYPPEGDDERTLVDVRFEFGDDAVRIDLTDDEKRQIFEYFETQIQECELD